MNNRPPQLSHVRQAGITLVELSIAMSLAAFLAGAVVTIQTTSTERFESSLVEHRVNTVSRDAAATIRKELRSCLHTSVQAFNYKGNKGQTIFRFQQAVSFDTANGTTNWGAETTVGAFVEYAIDGTDLVRRIVMDRNEVLKEEVMMDHLDLDPPEAGNGLPAQFTWDGDNNVVTVLINRAFPIDGTTVKRQLKTLIYIDPVFDF